jgi:hypothetical protein
MARKSKAATQTQAAADPAPENVPVSEPAGKPATGTAEEPRQPAQEAANGQPAYPTDPNAKISVSLSDYRGGPSMHLLRSHKFKQMQIRFDGQQPDEQYLAMLAEAGWKDRTESEGVFTKQIDPNARWQSVQQMESEFKQVANAIRESKGLEPVLAGMAVV